MTNLPVEIRSHYWHLIKTMGDNAVESLHERIRSTIASHEDTERGRLISDQLSTRSAQGYDAPVSLCVQIHFYFNNSPYAEKATAATVMRHSCRSCSRSA